MGKVKGNKPQMTPLKNKKPELTEEEREQNKKTKKRFIDHSTFLVAFTAIALVLIFAGRWVWAITDGYYDTFIKYGSGVEEAMTTAGGLTHTDSEEEALLTYEEEWDRFTSSRLCDQLTIEAADSDISLHGCFYNNESKITVIYLHQFGEDGTTDFLAGNWYYEQLNCNILLPDSRMHGESGGEYVSYGYEECKDLAAWMDYLDETYGEQTYVIWGTGLGANTALFADAQDLLPENVAYVVAESPYASIVTVAKTQMKKWYTVPAFPSLNFMEIKLNHSDAGFTTADLDLDAALTASATRENHVPVLFLSSGDDTYLYPEWTKDVYDNYPGIKSILTGTGTHETVFATDNSDVTAALEDLNAKYVK